MAIENDTTGFFICCNKKAEEKFSKAVLQVINEDYNNMKNEWIDWYDDKRERPDGDILLRLDNGTIIKYSDYLKNIYPDSGILQWKHIPNEQINEKSFKTVSQEELEKRRLNCYEQIL